MNKTLMLIVSTACLLLFSAAATSQPLKVVENLRHERVLLPPTTPDRGSLAPRDTVMFVDADGVAGIVVFYDDRRTRGEVDYIEFYDLEGDLLLVSWIDRTGVRQVAMDRGLLDPDRPTVDRVLFIIKLGTEL